MPEKSNGPTPAKLDLDKLNEAISKKIGQCPLCGVSHSFTAMPEIMELRQFFHGDTVLGGKMVFVPLVVLTCSNCGNTVLINAIQTNAIKKESEDKGGEQH